MFHLVPGGFIPAQDKQYLIGIVQLPDAASLDRTEKVVRQISKMAKETPGVDHAIGFSGLSVQGFVNLSNAAVLFFPLKPFDERKTKDLSAGAIAGALNKKFSSIQDAVIFAVPPPPVQGLGTTGGFKLFLQDRGAHGYDELARVTAEVLNKARQQHELNPYATYTTFQNSVPQLFADVDRVKAKNQGVPLSNVFDTLQAYLGSVYINDFNRFGRTYRVYAQAEPQFRNQPEDIANLKMRNLRGDMVPMGAVADVRFESGPDRVSHYNVYLASDINGQGSPGTSSGQASAAMERVLHDTLPNGFGYEWTDLTFQQKSAGNTALLVFPICVMLVFLILSAQYESWALPLAVILIVPMCLLSAMSGVWLKGSDNNVLTQIGFIVLVGLACKNAILIVEFARERVVHGLAPHRCGDRSMPAASAPDSHDLVRLHHGRDSARDRERRRQRNAPGDRHRRVLRHAGRDVLRLVPDAGIFRDHRSVVGEAQECGRGTDPAAGSRPQPRSRAMRSRVARRHRRRRRGGRDPGGLRGGPAITIGRRRRWMRILPMPAEPGLAERGHRRTILDRVSPIPCSTA